MNPQTPQLIALLARQPTWYEHIPADPAYARTILDQLVDEELTAVMAQTAIALQIGNPGLHRTAHTLAYDAARKAVDAVLLTLGLRITRDGGHVATVEAASAIFQPPPPARTRNIDAFQRSRRIRHDDEYPRKTSQPPLTIRERRPLTQNCIRLVNDARSLAGLDSHDDLVPTDSKVKQWATHHTHTKSATDH